MRTQHNQDGITLLVTLLLMGVLLGVSTSLLNVTLKQYQLSGVAVSSEIAFQAANAGMECALYNDFLGFGNPNPNSVFDVPNDEDEEQATQPSITCMEQLADAQTIDIIDTSLADPGNGMMASGEEQRFEFDWGSDPVVCTMVSIYKFASTTQVTVNGQDMRNKNNSALNECPVGAECTVIQSRGYNVSCGDIGGGNRVVEREYTQVY